MNSKFKDIGYFICFLYILFFFVDVFYNINLFIMRTRRSSSWNEHIVLFTNYFIFQTISPAGRAWMVSMDQLLYKKYDSLLVYCTFIQNIVFLFKQYRQIWIYKNKYLIFALNLQNTSLMFQLSIYQYSILFFNISINLISHETALFNRCCIFHDSLNF